MTDFKYPSLEMIESLFVGTSVLEKVNIVRFDDLAKTFHYGAFFLSSFTSDFDQDFFQTDSDDKYDFAENFSFRNNCAMGGQALINSSSLIRENQKRKLKKSKYPNSIFHTGHILGHQLIYNIPKFNFNSSNQENLMATTLKSKKNKDGKLKLYYQVNLLYSNEEQVPRATLQQILSNNQEVFSNRIVLIPNIDLKTKINYLAWNHVDNIFVE